MNKKSIALYAILVGLMFLLVGGWYAYAFNMQAETPNQFDGSRAYEDVRRQVELGSRAPGTEGHARVQEYIRGELESAGWRVEFRNNAAGTFHPKYHCKAKRILPADFARRAL